MNLKNLKDSVLIQKVESLVKDERDLLAQVLHYLKEIERRRLFSQLGYKSLHDFAVRHLGYSDDQAYRRVAAMRILRELPEMETKITSGELSLNHIGLAHSLFKQEKKVAGRLFSKEEKLEVFDKISAKPYRDAERIAFSMTSIPAYIKSDQIRAIADERVELKFQASKKLQEKINQLKGLLVHRNPDIPLGELFETLCDMGLREWNPSRARARPSSVKISSKEPNKNSATSMKHRGDMNGEGETSLSKAQLRRDVFQRADNKCENCGSGYALEVDHIYPKAKGGLDSMENLRMLCRSCYQRAAVRAYGLGKLDPFIN